MLELQSQLVMAHGQRLGLGKKLTLAGQNLSCIEISVIGRYGPDEVTRVTILYFKPGEDFGFDLPGKRCMFSCCLRVTPNKTYEGI